MICCGHSRGKSRDLFVFSSQNRMVRNVVENNFLGTRSWANSLVGYEMIEVVARGPLML